MLLKRMGSMGGSNAVRLLLGLAVLAGTVAQAQGLKLTTEESPPSNMTVGGRVIGAGADKVFEMFNRAGAAYSITVLPWARAYEQAQRDAETCVFSTTRIPERESRFKWVGPITSSEWVFFGREDSPLRSGHLKALEDARPYHIGTYNADVRDSYLKSRGFNVDTTLDDVTNVRKLLAGRIDLWASDKIGARQVMKRAGVDKGIVPVLVFNRFELYLACNPAVPDVLIDRLGTALRSMDKDGTSQAIDRRYENWPVS